MTFNKLSSKKISIVILGILALSTSLFALPDDIIFVSTDSLQWSVEGRVTTMMVDTTLGFVFSFDEDNPPLARPDTVYLDLNSAVVLTGCDSIFVKYNSMHDLPTTDSWVAGDVTVLVRHPLSQSWTEIYDEDLTNIGGWVNKLKLRLKVAVRSNPDEPGSYVLHNIRFIGNCQ